MAPKTLVIAGLLCQTAFASCGGGDYTTNNLTWTSSLRMNQIQVIGTHNSYHIESPLEERLAQASLTKNPTDFFYSHPALDIQLGHQRMRNLEIDVLADPQGGNYAKPLVRKKAGLQYDDDPVWRQPGTKVLHIPDVDIHSVCKTLVACLKVIKTWMDAHPKAVPIPIMMEFKTADNKTEKLGGAKYIPWNDAALLATVDAEIRSVFGPEQLITPDDITRPDETLESSVVKYGWPDLESARGRIFFLMDNGPISEVRDVYKAGKPNLEGRVLFTNAKPGDSDCAFQKLNDPISEKQIQQIQSQVKKNYYIRTRADEPADIISNAKCSPQRRNDALKSGAQVVSTDWQAYGMSSRYGCDYAAALEGGRAARCNPVNSRGCVDLSLEEEAYRWN